MSRQVAAHARLVDVIRSIASELVLLDAAHERLSLDAHLVAHEEDIRPLSSRFGTRIIVGDIGEAALRRSIRAKDGGLISPDISVGHLRTVLAAATDGYYLVPRYLAQAVVTRLETPQPPTLSPRDLTILRHLADGGTTVDLAQRLGCSERHTRRHLRALWETMNVQTRAQGLVAAARRGFLEETITASPTERSYPPRR